MGSDGHAYQTGLMRYLKDDWWIKKGRRFTRFRKIEYVWCCEQCDTAGKGFYCGVFACMF